MSDLRTRLLTVVQERVTKARAAQRDWPSIIGIVEGDPPFVAPDTIIEHIAANDPTKTIRFCERDLEVLERHQPSRLPGVPGPACWHGRGYTGWPCPDIVDLAEAYEVPIEVPA